MEWNCDICSQRFGSWRARERHVEALGHRKPHYCCDYCYLIFSTEADTHTHMELYSHWKYKCSCCDFGLLTEADVKQHEAERHWWCSKCDRGFQSYNNIKMHLNSHVHRGKSLKCPYCPLNFTTVSGLAHHLETASCTNRPNLNRDELYKEVRRQDPGGVLTNKLIGWPGSTLYKANAQTWNGNYYECNLCHRPFNTLYSLTQHLRSPIHQHKLYHCLNSDCAKEFTSMAGVSNHLESESCHFMRFLDVQRTFRSIISGSRLITC